MNMNAIEKKEASVILALALSPFVAALLISATLPFAFLPISSRNLAAGESLVFPGTLLSMAIAATVIFLIHQNSRNIRDEKLATRLAVACSLMAIPVWSVGLMPSINGLSLGATHQTPMRLERLETSTISKSRGLYHWARLDSVNAGDGLKGGRFFIEESTYDQLGQRQATTATVTHAKGLLGAEVVLDISSK